MIDKTAAVPTLQKLESDDSALKTSQNSQLVQPQQPVSAPPHEKKTAALFHQELPKSAAKKAWHAIRSKRSYTNFSSSTSASANASASSKKESRQSIFLAAAAAIKHRPAATAAAAAAAVAAVTAKGAAADNNSNSPKNKKDETPALNPRPEQKPNKENENENLEDPDLALDLSHLQTFIFQVCHKFELSPDRPQSGAQQQAGPVLKDDGDSSKGSSSSLVSRRDSMIEQLTALFSKLSCLADINSFETSCIGARSLSPLSQSKTDRTTDVDEQVPASSQPCPSPAESHSQPGIESRAMPLTQVDCTQVDCKASSLDSLSSNSTRPSTQALTFSDRSSVWSMSSEEEDEYHDAVTGPEPDAGPANAKSQAKACSSQGSSALPELGGSLQSPDSSHATATPLERSRSESIASSTPTLEDYEGHATISDAVRVSLVALCPLSQVVLPPRHSARFVTAKALEGLTLHHPRHEPHNVLSPDKRETAAVNRPSIEGPTLVGTHSAAKTLLNFEHAAAAAAAEDLPAHANLDLSYLVHQPSSAGPPNSPSHPSFTQPHDSRSSSSSSRPSLTSSHADAPSPSLASTTTTTTATSSPASSPDLKGVGGGVVQDPEAEMHPASRHPYKQAYLAVNL